MNVYELRTPGSKSKATLIKDKEPQPYSVLRALRRAGKTPEEGVVYYNAMTCEAVYADGFNVIGLEDFGEGTAAAIAELLVSCDEESGESMG